LRDIIDYELTAAISCLKIALKHRERWLKGSLEMEKRAPNHERSPYAFVIPQKEKDN
jgi:hypothetical protein